MKQRRAEADAVGIAVDAKSASAQHLGSVIFGGSLGVTQEGLLGT